MKKSLRERIKHFHEAPSLLASIGIAAFFAAVTIHPLGLLLCSSILVLLGVDDLKDVHLMSVGLVYFSVWLGAILAWRTIRYANPHPHERRNPVRRFMTPTAAPHKINLVHLGIVAAEAFVVSAVLSHWYWDEFDELIHVAAVACIPGGLIMSHYFTKAANRRGWPAIAPLLLTAFCTPIFVPLYCWAIAVTLVTFLAGMPFVAIVSLPLWFVWLLATMIWGDEVPHTWQRSRRRLAKGRSRNEAAAMALRVRSSPVKKNIGVRRHVFIPNASNYTRRNVYGAKRCTF